jgi:type IV pilus assembly protein PilM
VAKTVVGVDISAAGLRAVEIVASAKSRPALLRFHTVALPAGAVSRGEVVEKETVATAFKQLWSGGKFSSKDAVLGIGNARVFARNLSVPKMSLEEIRESLPFQVQDMIPFPVEDAVLDFYPISESAGENGHVIDGLLVGAVREALVGNITAAQLAGLNTLEVDLNAFALVRAFQSGASAGGTSAVVDIGANTTTVVVATDGVPQFIRIIPTGGSDLTTALATKLSVTPEQAELMKRTVGLTASREEDRAIGAATLELTAELMNSLRTTLAFFANAKQAAPISRIILTGGGSMLHGFSTALSEYTRMPVAIGDPLKAVTAGTKGKRGALIAAVGGTYSVAIGLALWAAA